jgi:hypothetical protein
MKHSFFQQNLRRQKTLIVEIDSEEENNECIQDKNEEIIVEKTPNHIALEEAIDTRIRIKNKVDHIDLILLKDHVGDTNQVDILRFLYLTILFSP